VPNRRRVTAVKRSLREVNNQIALLSRQIGVKAEMRDIDLDCLDFLSRQGAMGPTTLARELGVHPATLTGVLDRLERDGWIERGRDPHDRRAVLVRALPQRNAEMFRLYSGMNDRMDEICGGYDDEQLAVIDDFLRRVADAGHAETDRLANG
jgi:DNA-binding MarR family transcriptional regulator